MSKALNLLAGCAGVAICWSSAFLFLYAGGFVQSPFLQRIERRWPLLAFLTGMSSAENFRDVVRATPLHRGEGALSRFRRAVLLVGAIIMGLGAAVFAIATLAAL